MRLSDIKGERAIEVIADLIDPITILANDKVLRKKLDKDRLGGVKYLLKTHSKLIVEVLAIINDEDPETYEPDIFALPIMLLDFLNDPKVEELFGLQSQTTEKTSSGSVTVNTEANET